MMINRILRFLRSAPDKNLKSGSQQAHIDPTKDTTPLPKLESYDLTKLKGGESNSRKGGGWDVN